MSLLFVTVAVAILGIIAFNRLVHLRNQVRNAWADIDVQLRRRHDLIPQVVEAVKGYAGYERGVLTAVTELRSKAMSTASPAQLGQVEGSLEKALTQLFALKEAYPDLKANQSFLQLQRDLVEVEDNVQYARRFYNGAVRDYNTAIQSFPTVVFARGFGFSESEFFSAEEEDRAVVQANLG